MIKEKYQNSIIKFKPQSVIFYKELKLDLKKKKMSKIFLLESTEFTSGNFLCNTTTHIPIYLKNEIFNLYGERNEEKYRLCKTYCHR